MNALKRLPASESIGTGARTRETGALIMLKRDLHPPHTGPDADPVLYGIAAGLAELFPLILPPSVERETQSEHDTDQDSLDRD